MATRLTRILGLSPKGRGPLVAAPNDHRSGGVTSAGFSPGVAHPKVRAWGRGGVRVISKPEMSDEPGGDSPGSLLGGSDDPADATTAVRKPRPWLWAASGIVLTSAVWATAMHGTGGVTPDLHGYHLGGNPCGGETLNPVKVAVGAQGFAASEAKVSRGPALDKLSCALSASPPDGDGWVTDYTVSVSVELHKKTDPRAEFQNSRQAKISTLAGGDRYSNVLIVDAETGFISASEVHPVTGIGDEAHVLERRASDQALEVLHGGAVLTLRVSGYSRWNGPGKSPVTSVEPPEEPDLTRLRPAMTISMRQLMTSLAS